MSYRLSYVLVGLLYVGLGRVTAVLSLYSRYRVGTDQGVQVLVLRRDQYGNIFFSKCISILGVNITWFAYGTTPILLCKS